MAKDTNGVAVTNNNGKSRKVRRVKVTREELLIDELAFIDPSTINSVLAHINRR
jgi:hypothetical protein